MEKDKEPFSEKHPKLNMLFGLLLCGGFVVFAIFFARVLFNVVIKGIIKLSTITSRLDAVVIVALITSGVSLASVIISSIVAKILEYRKIIRNLAKGMLDTFKVTVICVVPSYLGVIHAAERIIGTQFRTYFSTNLSLNPGLNLYTGGAA